ncbi:cytochrome P450 9e2-like isoform X2 [Copidosoma floridanum]|uniref:cytochrome P450 9e2-like isoform X2 n=1 Tax=Copidosoma floridanum TaxID=29053 RepID=UPI0006C9AA23|nr:cytochrome P450 9e2-like isoform X2 [Copidosoma floridanum]
MDFWIWCSLIIPILVYTVTKVFSQLCYFSKWGIPHPLELPIVGVMHMLFLPRRHVNDLIKCIYNTNRQAKYVGAHVFLSSTIFVRDLDLIKSILIKNFDHFADRKTFVDEKVDPLFGLNLNFLNGDRWREIRNILSPSFTSSKMRSMYALMSDCAKKFSDAFIKIHKDEDDIDIKDAFSKYTNDVIASCAFGIEVDSVNNPNNEFYLRAKEVAVFKLLLELLFPDLTRKFGMRIVSKRLTDFFINVIDTTIKAREEKGIVRPDMLQLLMEARSTMSKERAAKFNLTEMTAQAFLFFLAGFEASATQSSLMAFEMALNPDVQSRVQIEIDEVMLATKGRPTYDAIGNMTYLDAVFSETLRKHPIAFLNRLCSKEFELPPAIPGAKPYKMTPGMGIMIPVAGIHADPDLYDNPDKFEPERFIGKKSTSTDVSNLGFGMGPRMCIGNRFAILEIKALFVYLLAKCTLVPCGKTCIPFVYQKNLFAAMPENGFWLKIEPRNKA